MELVLPFWATSNSSTGESKRSCGTKVQTQTWFTDSAQTWFTDSAKTWFTHLRRRF